MSTIPVITIDGPSGVGKGTMTCRLAKNLGWHILDSGVLYRAVALHALEQHVASEDESAIVALAQNLPIQFTLANSDTTASVLLANTDVTHVLRSEECAAKASEIAKLPGLRQALLTKQRAFRQAPGLVTDGRDMGTAVFPDADVKFFLQASVLERAKRRQSELKQKGICASLEPLLDQLRARDTRDQARQASPLKSAEDAVLLDTSDLGIDEVFALLLYEVNKRIGLK